MCRKIAAMLLCVVLAFFTTGCNIIGNVTDDIKSPQPSSVYYDIMQGLTKVAGKDFSLAYARSGKHRSAIITEDIDKDSILDAIAFYNTKTDDETTVTHINLITSQKEVWSSVCDIELPYVSVETVEFYDLDGDAVSEILVGLKAFNSLNFDMIVFSIENGQLVQRMKEAYTTYTTFSADSGNYLVTLSIDAETKVSFAKVFSLKDNISKEISHCNLDGEVTSYDTPIITKMPNGETAIIVDAVKSAGLITEVLLNIDTGITAPLNSKINGENSVTLRSSSTRCMDYDGDGVYEIPFTSQLVGSATSETESVYLVSWKKFDGTKFVHVADSVINSLDGYIFEIPDEWLGKFTIIRDIENKTRLFYEWDDKTKATKDEIFRIQVFNIYDWEQIKDSNSNFTELGRDYRYVYAYSSGTSELFSVIENIDKSFKLTGGAQ